MKRNNSCFPNRRSIITRQLLFPFKETAIHLKIIFLRIMLIRGVPLTSIKMVEIALPTITFPKGILTLLWTTSPCCHLNKSTPTLLILININETSLGHPQILIQSSPLWKHWLTTFTQFNCLLYCLTCLSYTANPLCIPKINTHRWQYWTTQSTWKRL